MSQTLTGRSVVLSVLLGAHPAWATAAELLRLTADFGIREPTLRVTLTRMVGAGDLVRSDDGYRLSDRLLARQLRQDRALHPVTRDWDGAWITAVVTAVGTDARSRATLRTALQDNRFGELREGVWLRPDNLDGDVPELARSPQGCLRADRLSALHQWGQSERDAMDFEFGSLSQVAAESIAGAQRFADGAGRHGRPV